VKPSPEGRTPIMILDSDHAFLVTLKEKNKSTLQGELEKIFMLVKYLDKSGELEEIFTKV
jgi:hypothetical protein